MTNDGKINTIILGLLSIPYASPRRAGKTGRGQELVTVHIFIFEGVLFMETINLISTMVSQLGFPVAMCIILFYSLNQERKDHKESEETINRSINELKETFTLTIHGQQEKMTEAINNNTLVMQRLIDQLEKG